MLRNIGTLKAVIIPFAVLTGLCIICTAFHKKAEETVSKDSINSFITNELSDTSSLHGLDKEISRFMQYWKIQGVSLTVMRNDSLLYAKGYGYADKEKDVPMEASKIMRLASISKLITATGIMVLREKGLLSLRDTVFGKNGILNDDFYLSSINDRNYYKITVEDLLRHKGGFTIRSGDPIFSTRTIMLQNHLKTPPDSRTLLKCYLKRRLSYVPGTSQSYSNFGYLLLSLIIEKVSGEDYEDFIQREVLQKAGCYDFHIAGNYYKDKYKNEVRYYVQSNDKPVQEYNNSGKEVIRCYGGNDIKALSGAGAWVGSTAELSRFVASIDGKPGIPDILQKESVDRMVEYFDNLTYSFGWNDTNPESGWTRSGTFSGTSALIKYFPDGECWILVTNTSTWKGPGMSRYISRLYSTLRQTYSSLLPKRNLFERPVEE